jgi:Flp pilus assembly secretin CpaC
MVEQQPKGGLQAAIGRSLCLAAFFAGLVFATPACFADQTTPLSVERPTKQTMMLTQGFSTTIHSERPFGKISITDPDIVDLVVRTDKSAVLIPQRLGRTNIDFLDDHGSLIGSMEARISRKCPTRKKPCRQARLRLAFRWGASMRRPRLDDREDNRYANRKRK